MAKRNNIQRLAHTINLYCEDYEYFWGTGLIKETISLWRVPENYSLLSEYAQVYADYYLEHIKSRRGKGTE